MDYVITYDISNTKTRNKIAALLKNFGDRVQFSVFELPQISKERFNQCYQQLKQIAAKNFGDDDSIRIYPICGNCVKTIKVISKTKQKPMHLPKFYIID